MGNAIQGAVRVALDGCLTRAAGAASHDVLRKAASKAEAQGARLVVDLHALRAIDTFGLRLLRAAVGSAKDVSLHRPSAVVREVLVISGFDKLFEIVEASSQEREFDAHRDRPELCATSFTINAN